MTFFDTANEKEATGFEILPDGTYRAIIVGMKYKPTKAGDGAYLAATFQVAEGKHEGRMIFSNFNIENPNEKAQQIGRGQFKSLLKALGITEALATPDDAARVCQDKICKIKVGSRVDNRNGQLQNVVKEFYPDSAGAVPAGNPTTVAGVNVNDIF